ncbi:MAG: DUF2723 domain-containing protein [Bacteroidetes bacterium]|nr:DUF2723 domain-containing protein [Bacteroidota bacterium]
MGDSVLTPGHPVAPPDGIPRRTILAAAFAGLLALGVYWYTLLPDVEWADPAEFALQAYQLGVTHPPGAPLHSMLGYLFCQVIPDPAQASNLLSAVATAATVSLFVMLGWRLTRSLPAAAIVALVYAFSPRLWSMAVTTEVYNLNALLFAAALYALLSWHRTAKRSALVFSAVFFGLSLGDYLADLLLLPVFLYLIWRRSRMTLRDTLLYLVVTGMTALPFLLFIVLRSTGQPPLGTDVIPNGIAELIRYLTASQYSSAGPMAPLTVLHRIGEHALILSGNVLHVGLLAAVAGAVGLWRRDRNLLTFFLLILALDLGYFTAFNRYEEYYAMVTPAHLIIAVLMVIGAADLAGRFSAMRLWIPVVAVAAALVLFLMQFPERLARSECTPVQDFVESTFELAPEHAVVIAAWGEFTPLRFYQMTTGQRGDLRIIERNPDPRHYAFGAVESSDAYIQSVIPSRPVIIDLVDDSLRKRYVVQTLHARWKELRLHPSTE